MQLFPSALLSELTGRLSARDCAAVGVRLKAPPECRAEGFCTRRGNSSSSLPSFLSSPRSLPSHHNKLIPTSLTSHPRQSSELGARQGRTRARRTGCWATARLGRSVTRMLMKRLLGDGNGDVSRKDVSPRDVSVRRGSALLTGSQSRASPERERAHPQQEQKQKAGWFRCSQLLNSKLSPN